MPTEDPFRVLVRKGNPYEAGITLRFTVAEGMGQLSLKSSGRAEVGLAVHHEEVGIDPELFRAARFVYNLNNQRQSFALSRLTPELCLRLSTEQWTELKPVIEFGFRYLVIPDGALATAPIQVQVAASVVPLAGPASLPPPGAFIAPAAVRAGEPLPSRPPESDNRIERPVPMQPALAAAALEGLSREAALGHLRLQLTAVDAMHHRLEALERKLSASRAREKDLLAVLTAWQDRDSTSQ